MVYLNLFFIPQSSRDLKRWPGWTLSPTLEGFADSALASASSPSLSSSTGSQSDSVDQLSCTEHTLNLLLIFLRSWFSQFVKVCHYCHKNTNHLNHYHHDLAYMLLSLSSIKWKVKVKVSDTSLEQIFFPLHLLKLCHKSWIVVCVFMGNKFDLSNK